MARKIDMAEITALSVDERIALVQAIWDTIAAEPHQSMLTEEQRLELRRRAAEDDAELAGGIPWEQVNAEARARMKKSVPGDGPPAGRRRTRIRYADQRTAPAAPGLGCHAPTRLGVPPAGSSLPLRPRPLAGAAAPLRRAQPGKRGPRHRYVASRCARLPTWEHR